MPDIYIYASVQYTVIEYTYSYAHTPVYAVYICRYVHAHVRCLYRYVYTYICIHTSMYVHMHVHMYSHIHIYFYTHATKIVPQVLVPRTLFPSTPGGVPKLRGGSRGGWAEAVVLWTTVGPSVIATVIGPHSYESYRIRYLKCISTSYWSLRELVCGTKCAFK